MKMVLATQLSEQESENMKEQREKENEADEETKWIAGKPPLHISLVALGGRKGKGGWFGTPGGKGPGGKGPGGKGPGGKGGKGPEGKGARR